MSENDDTILSRRAMKTKSNELIWFGIVLSLISLALVSTLLVFQIVGGVNTEAAIDESNQSSQGGLTVIEDDTPVIIFDDLIVGSEFLHAYADIIELSKDNNRTEKWYEELDEALAVFDAELDEAILRNENNKKSESTKKQLNVTFKEYKEIMNSMDEAVSMMKNDGDNQLFMDLVSEMKAKSYDINFFR